MNTNVNIFIILGAFHICIQCIDHILPLLPPASSIPHKSPMSLSFPHGDLTFHFILLYSVTSPHLHLSPLSFFFPHRVKFVLHLQPLLWGQPVECVWPIRGHFCKESDPPSSRKQPQFMSAATLSCQNALLISSSHLPSSISLGINAYRVKIQKYCVA